MMQGGARRSPITRSSVAAGSVWETRMKMDEVKGGIKVFNGGEDDEQEEGIQINRPRLKRNQSDGVATTERRKRKSWRAPDTPPAISTTPRTPIQLRKARSDLGNSRSDANCREFGREKIVRSGSGNAGAVGEKRVLMIGDGHDDDNGDELELEEEMKMEEELEEERKSFDDKEIVLPTEKLKNVEEEKRINQIQDIPVSSDSAKKPIPHIHHQNKDPIPTNPPPVEMEEEVLVGMSGAQNRMENIVDLVMWRDTSKSALVFGLGTFILLSSSYTKDINFSLISGISYLGLVYLALIYLYKSILHRGAMELEEGEEREVVGEEDAIWLLRFLLPYINEMLLKARALFSGDPATTMKLAVLLFVMARCGSSITIWTLAKLVFFGIFTIPKVCSSYKVQLARYGKWELC